MNVNRYTCEQVFARLDDFLDRELSAEEMQLVQGHLDHCAACAAEHRFESAVLADVRKKLVRIDLPAGLRSRISDQLLRLQDPPPG